MGLPKQHRLDPLPHQHLDSAALQTLGYRTPYWIIYDSGNSTESTSVDFQHKTLVNPDLELLTFTSPLQPPTWVAACYNRPCRYLIRASERFE